jgi:endo-1,4-beta-mannosidase
MLEGKEYRAIGVNLPHLASGYNGSWGSCRQIYGTPEKMRAAVVEGIRDAGSNKMAFIRFFAMPGRPTEKAKLYDVDKAEYWRQMDAVLNLCREQGIRVIPILGVNRWVGYPELYKELATATTDPNSRQYKDIWTYIEEFVTRYKDDPVILMWSLSNEAFLRVDQEKENPNPKDVFTFDVMLDLYKHSTARIKKLAPNAIVTSGDNGVRRESACRRGPVAEALKTNKWPPKYALRQDTLKEHLANLLESQQSVDVASIHAYVKRAGEGDWYYMQEKIGTIAYNGERVRAFRAAGKPVLVGELGQVDPYFRDDPTGQAGLSLIDLLEKEGASLIGLWSWHFRWQDRDYRKTSDGNDLNWNIPSGASVPVLMERVAAFNRKYAGK